MAKTMGIPFRALCIVQTACGTQEARLYVRKKDSEPPEYFWKGRYLQQYSLDPFAEDTVEAKSDEQAVQRFQKMLLRTAVFPRKESPSDVVSLSLVQRLPLPAGARGSTPFPWRPVETAAPKAEALAA
ncbi:hypothetical protein [Paraburkholderia sp. J8-2]|uniref:hypothetical protein n=1 Tax=Paraburkholderia sp. J8-2 TaxID=2805440 RepID=UPI002AB6FFC0|nr:hypothetical protein [Paraburkholderia sp. J8-2]